MCPILDQRPSIYMDVAVLSQSKVTKTDN